MQFIFVGGLFLAFIILSTFLKRRKLSKKLKKLRDNWGIIPEDIFDLETAKIFFELKKARPCQHGYYLDDDTWHDLDFDEILVLMNRATTPIGAQYLFYLLKNPTFDKEILDSREEHIDLFLRNQNLREKIQIALQFLEEKNAKYLPYGLWKPLPDKPAYAKFLPFLSFIALLAVVLVLLQFVHFIFIIIVFIINLAIRAVLKRRIDPFIYSFQNLGVLISVAGKIAALKSDALQKIRNELNENLKGTESIAKKIFTLQFKDEFGLIEYLNIYFLWDIAGFYSALDKIRQHLKKLRNLYEIIGYLDAMISVASFRQQYQEFCRPSFSKNPNRYFVENIFNPLLEKPVANSFDFSAKHNIITGSNMAGKTTFLKTMGVNAILAQTIHTCMAAKYEAPLIKVVSSISRSDDLLTGKSYYLAEVESILRILKASKSETVHLFLVDEIFRGTNSVERFAASVEVLEYLANDKDYILVATHDLQLSEILNHEYHNFHFREKVCEKGLSFDYKLHPGPSTTRKAIALLEYVGYPKSIVENASRRANDDSMEHGR